ncbi:MAG: hypothetical protein OEU84_11105 [Xanthomonadales bacterium]|jgi:hypothetical protein|nr:hypothetical protein [Xanthomonadales bacterium]MDH4020138.1 hypothetical protein [Xanthomonadales bacterium]
MDHTLIFLLIFSLALAVVSYYFGIHRPLPVGAWRSQSAFVVLTFMLIPILVYVLVDQSGAIGRLEGTGIRAHPGIKESVGIANGKGDNPTWVFEVQASGAEINEFYRAAENIGDWSFQSDDGIYLRLRRNDRVMKIAFRDGHSSDTIIYIIEDA